MPGCSALMYSQNGDLANLLKSARKKSAPECPFECGGGGNRYLGNAQIEVPLTVLGLPLLHHVVKEPFFKKSYEWRYDRYFYFLQYNMFQPWCTHCTLYKGEVGFLSSCWVLKNLFFSSAIKRSLSLVNTLSHCT